ncbi:MAG: filamentous hemagglutinin N-terminal domain-containing protein [Candidatus Melainabacteria bacterium]|nr:filamentous hemagglutinin N-terminal domain-containing protein [Candidatus Melainabacteria bacterium]
MPMLTHQPIHPIQSNQQKQSPLWLYHQAHGWHYLFAASGSVGVCASIELAPLWWQRPSGWLRQSALLATAGRGYLAWSEGRILWGWQVQADPLLPLLRLPRRRWLRQASALFCLAWVLQSALMHAAMALPTGWEVVEGQVSFHMDGTTLNVTSQSTQAIVNYQSFNVGAGETVNFLFTSPAASLLNRVVGGEATSIMGTITANGGTVLLSNTAGVSFGNTANVQVGNLMATCLQMSNADYLNQQWTLRQAEGLPSALVSNEGTITTETGGSVVLAGGAVANTGTITAPGGHVALAVGDQVTVSMGNVNLQVTVDEALKQQVQGLQSAIAHHGRIDAKTVELQAKLTESLYSRAVNTTGIIQATTLANDGGHIRVLAEGGGATVQHSGVMDASAQTGGKDGGTVTLVADNLIQQGEISADALSEGTAGEIRLTAAQDTQLEAGSLLSARGLGANSHGGEVVVWSDGDTHYQPNARIDVRGGDVSGNGGFVEVSAKDTVDFRGTTQLGAVAGSSGRLLIDPTDFTIDGSNIAALTSVDGNIDIWATRDITVYSNPHFALQGSGETVTLRAGRDLTVHSSLSTAGGNLNLYADADTTDMGGTLPDNVGNLTLNGAVSTNNGNANLTGVNISFNNGFNAGSGTINATSHGNGNVVANRDVRTTGTVNLTATGTGNVTTDWWMGYVIGNTVNMTADQGHIMNMVQASNLSTNTNGWSWIGLDNNWNTTNIGNSTAGQGYTLEPWSAYPVFNGTLTASQININTVWGADINAAMTATSGNIQLIGDTDFNDPNTSDWFRINAPLVAQNGSIIIQTPSIAINNQVQANNGSVSIYNTTNKAIEVGANIASNSDNASRLHLSASELGQIQTNHLYVGNTSRGGGLTVTGNLDTASTLPYTLTLRNQGNITSNNFALNGSTSRPIHLNASTTGNIIVNAFGDNMPIKLGNVTANNATFTYPWSGSYWNTGSDLLVNGNINLQGNFYADWNGARINIGNTTSNTANVLGSFTLTGGSQDPLIRSQIQAGSFSFGSVCGLDLYGSVTTTNGGITLTADTDNGLSWDPIRLYSGSFLNTSSNNGTIAIQGPLLQIDNGASINAGNGTVELRVANSAGHTTQIGSAVDNFWADDATTTDISLAELQRINAGTVVIGTPTSLGSMRLLNGLDISSAGLDYNLTLRAQNTIDLGQGQMTLGNNTLTVESTNGNLTGNWSVSSQAGNMVLNAPNGQVSTGLASQWGTGQLLVNGLNQTANLYPKALPVNLIQMTAAASGNLINTMPEQPRNVSPASGPLPVNLFPEGAGNITTSSAVTVGTGGTGTGVEQPAVSQWEGVRSGSLEAIVNTQGSTQGNLSPSPASSSQAQEASVGKSPAAKASALPLASGGQGAAEPTTTQINSPEGESTTNSPEDSTERLLPGNGNLSSSGGEDTTPGLELLRKSSQDTQTQMNQLVARYFAGV